MELLLIYCFVAIDDDKGRVESEHSGANGVGPAWAGRRGGFLLKGRCEVRQKRCQPGKLLTWLAVISEYYLRIYYSEKSCDVREAPLSE